MWLQFQRPEQGHTCLREVTRQVTAQHGHVPTPLGRPPRGDALQVPVNRELRHLSRMTRDATYTAACSTRPAARTRQQALIHPPAPSSSASAARQEHDGEGRRLRRGRKHNFSDEI